MTHQVFDPFSHRVKEPYLDPTASEFTDLLGKPYYTP